MAVCQRNVRIGQGTAKRFWRLSCFLIGLLSFLLWVSVTGGGAVTAASARAAGGKPNGYVFFAEGIRLTAYFGDDTVRLVFSDGREVVLEQAVSASGARYTDGETLFWNKGDEALIEWEGESYLTRVATRTDDVWEQARQAGVHFRAVGQEPGWLLEIRSGDSLHLSLDYGLAALTVPLSEFRADDARRERTFAAKAPLSPVEVVVRVVEQACYDGMSGEGFTSRVTVTLPGSGKVYDGCGRDL